LQSQIEGVEALGGVRHKQEATASR
jgi:hypothetical protein